MRLFLRRFIDNDLISPHADRHESLAVIPAAALSLAVVVTFLISTDYLAAFIQLPGPTALSALSDRFLFISASMIVSGLAALMVWDAFDLESRDVAILGPLSIPARTITRAKLAAALVFGAVLAVALNAVPSVLYPTFLTLNLRGMSGRGVLQLVAGHATSVIAAAMFGFFTILAVRGVLRLILGERGFRRLSSVVQSALVVCAVTALLMTPTVRATRVSDWAAGTPQAAAIAVPPLWYLGLNENIAGYVVAETPLVMPPPLPLAPFLKRQDDAGRAKYRGLRPHFAGLARSAAVSLPIVAVCAIVCFLLNNRRLPDQSIALPGRSPARALVDRVAERLTRGDAEAQAGFFFSLHALARSAPHRTIVAISAAAGSTLPIVSLSTSGVQRIDSAIAPLGLLCIQLMLLSALTVGFRYAVTVPAELASNWTFRMAWRGDERSYIAGVKRAGSVAFVIVPSLFLLPLHIALFGRSSGVVHTLFGILLMTAILDVMFLTYRKMPFACGYVPIQNPKLLWPAGVAVFLLGNFGFASAARFGLQTPIRSALFCLILCTAIVVVKAVDWAMRRERAVLDFNEGPPPATQRLGLFDEIALRE